MTSDWQWEWLGEHYALMGSLLGEHVYFSALPVLLGLGAALPLGLACVRWPTLYPPVLAATSVLYALPSLPLFVVLLDYTGLSAATVVIPLTLYTLAVLVRNVVDGLRSVPVATRQAATAIGFSGARRLLQVELPIAVPVIFAGLRVATVSNISLVSVGSLLGFSGLGKLFTDGLQRSHPVEILAGIVLTIALAVAADTLLVLVQRLLTPWSRSGRSA